MSTSNTQLLFALKNFRNFLISRFTFTMALQMVSFAIAIYIYDLTGSKLSLGLLGLSEIIPAISLALYAGHVIDISDKRTLLFRNMLFYMLSIIALGFFVSKYAKQHFAVIQIEIAIYVCIFLTGIFRAFVGPTQQSIIAQLVPKDQLANGISWGSVSARSSMVAGPVLAGLLIDTIGMYGTFVVAFTFLVVGIVLIYLIPKLPVSNTNNQQRTWESVKEGIRYVWQTKTLLSALSLDMFAVFFGGVAALLPVFGKDILHLGATEISFLRAAEGVGSIVMLAWLTRHPLKNAQGKTMLWSVIAFGVLMIVFAISKNYWLSITALFLAGMFDGVSMLIRSTILQMFVPDEMRGRVSSVNSMFINSSNELGYFESGVAAQLLGTVPSVIFGGCMTILVVMVVAKKAPSLRNMEY